MQLSPNNFIVWNSVSSHAGSMTTWCFFRSHFRTDVISLQRKHHFYSEAVIAEISSKQISSSIFDNICAKSSPDDETYRFFSPYQHKKFLRCANQEQTLLPTHSRSRSCRLLCSTPRLHYSCLMQTAHRVCTGCKVTEKWKWLEMWKTKDTCTETGIWACCKNQWVWGLFLFVGCWVFFNSSDL